MKNLFKPWLYAALAACAAILPARAQGPVLDPSFAITSAVRIGGGPGSYIRDMLRQPDGKLVVAGDFQSLNGRPASRVARLLADGQVDTTFTAPPADGDVLTIALQADGKLLLGGYFTTVDGQSRIGIARLLSTGALDPTFLSPLGRSPSFGSYVYSSVSKIVVQPGRGILVLGFMLPIIPAPYSGFYAARLLEATGARDLTFQLPANARNTLNKDVLVLPTGKLVLASEPNLFNGQRCTVWGTLPDGALDPAFTPLPSTLSQSYGLALDPATGNIYVAAGTAGQSLMFEPVRLLPTGVPDPTFSTAGTFVAGATVGGVNSLAVQPNGHLLLGGVFPTAGGGYTGSARLLPSGALDPSYQAGNGPLSAVTKVLIQPDGALLFCGSFHQVQGLPVDCLTRMRDANVLSARPPALADEVDAWPVPAHEALHLRWPAARPARQAALLDGLGRVVLRQALPASQPGLTPPAPVLPTAGLPPGTYLLRLTFADGPPAYRRVLVE